MKKSHYNKFFDVEGTKLAFNGMTCALAEIDENFERLYNNIEAIDETTLDDNDKELISEMKRGFYIIPDSMDELALLKFRNYRGKFSSNNYALVIAPTLACNFGCPYCYEGNKQGVMDEAVKEKLVSMVKNNAERKQNIEITWYGGEPMLAKNIIYELSEKFISICEANNVNYYAGIITNGYLITDNDIELFQKYKIRSVQITVDGPARIHNQRRFLKANPAAGTFDAIIANVQKLHNTDINISLRINIDRTNIETTKELILYFKSLGLNKLNINFGHVSAYTDENDSIKEECLTMFEYSLESLQLQEFLHDNGFSASGFPHYPGIKANYCGADSANTFVVDPEGYLYKCWNEVGIVNMSVGNIMWADEDITDEMISRNIMYMTWDPFSDEECKDCYLLPICMGGCPYSGHKYGKMQCERWKYSLDEVLKKTYQQKQNQ